MSEQNTTVASGHKYVIKGMSTMNTLSTLILLLCLLHSIAQVTTNDTNTQPCVGECNDSTPDKSAESNDELTIDDHIWSKFDCEKVFKSDVLPIHDESTWMLLRGLYQGIVGNEKSTISPLTTQSGLDVPHYVGYSPGKGRAIFAMRPIKKGTRVWSTRQTARFYTGVQYKQFLHALHPELACDVIQWAYVQDVGIGFDGMPIDPKTYKKFDKLSITIDLDEGILFNSALYAIEDVDEEEMYYEEVQNVGCDRKAAESVTGGCSRNYFALRDIDAGEELTIIYGDFAEEDGWEHFGIRTE